MPIKEDLRVQRTKKALSDAFIKLLSEKPLEDITVNELCDVAGVRRATFYKHYADKFSFLTAYTRSLRDRFDTVIWEDPGESSSDYYVAYAKRIVTFILENKAAIDHVMNSDLFPSMLAIIVEQNYRDTCEHLNKSVSEGMKLSASVEVTSSMCAGGVAAIIYMWLKTGQKQSAEEISEQIGNMIASIFK